MIITEIQYFFSKIIRFQAIFKDTVEFTCALEFKISSQLCLWIQTLLDLIQFFPGCSHAVFLRQNSASLGSAPYLFLLFPGQNLSERLFIRKRIRCFPHLHTVLQPFLVHRDIPDNHRNLTGQCFQYHNSSVSS